MSRFASLTSRLVVTAVTLVVLVTVFVGAVTALAMRAYLTDQLDHDVAASLVREQRGPNGPGGPGPDGPEPAGRLRRRRRQPQRPLRRRAPGPELDHRGVRRQHLRAGGPRRRGHRPARRPPARRPDPLGRPRGARLLPGGRRQGRRRGRRAALLRRRGRRERPAAGRGPADRARRRGRGAGRSCRRPPPAAAAHGGRRDRALGGRAAARLGRDRLDRAGARPPHRRAHRGRPGRCRAQHPPGARRVVARRAARERAAGAAVRGRRLPRAADPAHDDRRLHRAGPEPARRRGGLRHRPGQGRGRVEADDDTGRGPAAPGAARLRPAARTRVPST